MHSWSENVLCVIHGHFASHWKVFNLGRGCRVSMQCISATSIVHLHFISTLHQINFCAYALQGGVALNQRENVLLMGLKACLHCVYAMHIVHNFFMYCFCPFGETKCASRLNKVHQIFCKAMKIKLQLISSKYLRWSTHQGSFYKGEN